MTFTTTSFRIDPEVMRMTMIESNPVRGILGAVENLDWWEAAACKGQTDVMFPPEQGQGAAHNAKVRAAQQICWECPVYDECLSYTMLLNKLRITPKDGVFAGSTPHDRRGNYWDKVRRQKEAWDRAKQAQDILSTVDERYLARGA